MNDFTMDSSENKTINRQAAVNGLAVVGFVALIASSFWLAVYAARFVPTVVNGAGEAAVYLGSLFIRTMPANRTVLSVVPTPTASTTLIFETASMVSTSSQPSPPLKKNAMTAGTKTSDIYQISGTTTPALFGLSDLIVNINAVGYLGAASTDSFIASSTVPADSRPAINFTIKNIGTNTTGTWRFSASIPTQTAYIYQSQPQQSLLPGDSIDYTLGFDQAIRGSDKMISITANFDHAVTESNFDNNSTSTKVTILGS